jgi:hypothetical protein
MGKSFSHLKVDKEKWLEVSPRTVNYCQKKLLIEGRLVREGKGKAAVYRLK